MDKGASQPNVFIDPKSVESAAPHFSSLSRSDNKQRRFLEAHHDWWQGSAAPAGMVDEDHIFVWTWDARPTPAFPDDLSVWRDGNNWRTGHWLNGRLGGTTLADAIAAILTEHGFTDFDVSAVSGDLTGYVQGELTSARALLEPLLEAFQVDVTEHGGKLHFHSRLKASLPPMEIGIIADIEGEPLWTEGRGHDSDFAAEAVLTSYNPRLDYEQASVRSRKTRAESQRTLGYDLPAVLPEETALGAVESLLRTQRIGRRTVSFALSPAEISIMPGDVVKLTMPDVPAPDGSFIVERIEEGPVRRIEMRHHAPLSPVNYAVESGRKDGGSNPAGAFSPILHFLDLPRFSADEATGFARIAAFSRPWRRMAVSSSATIEGYRIRTVLERPARTGVLTEALQGSVAGRFDRGGSIELDLYFGGLSSAEELAVLNGENRIAVMAQNGVWEVIGFSNAQEIAPNRWRLTNLLRGLAGTEDAMRAGAVPGAAVVVLDEAVVPLGLSAQERGLAMNWIVESLGQAGGRSGPITFAGGIRAETPLAPAHIRGERTAAGNIHLSWIRRGRIEADDWSAAEIPLDEPAERYRVELLDGTTIKRAAEITAPVFTYSAGEEIADFGAPQTSLSVRIRQMGRAVPLGIPAEAEILL